MKRFFLFLIAALITFGTAIAKDPEVTEVALVGEGVGNGGRPIVLVTCAAKKADKVTDQDIRRCALRGILFRGYADKSNTTSYDASTSHPALLTPDQEAGHADYFNDFFANDAYNAYVDIIPDNRKVMKAGKVYHVTQAVQVNVPGLRKKLEKDGIIRSLKSGW
ncbi:MAG: hypothetical protein HDS79_01450 [Bacteroidales bacterium]|nr:hypothetical protein [Bacteroidales bacterium]MDE7466599.1 hypothetical protein [Muribaculaceae bacterium]